METTPVVQPTMAPVRPRRHWWLYALVLLGLVALVPVGMFGYQSYATRGAWAEAEAEADRLDPNWRLDDLLREHEAIEPKQNSGLYMMGLAAQKKYFRVSGAKNYEDVFMDLPANARLNHQQLDMIRGELAKIAKPLAEARLLKNMPRGRFPITYSPDYIGTLIPNHQDARDIADWLKHDAYDLAERGKIDAAVESCQAMINTARVFADDLFLISHLIRVAIQMETTAALERTLAQGQASEETLKAMQDLVAKEMGQSGWLRAMRGERGGGHMLFTNIRAGKIKSTYLRGIVSGRGPEGIGERIQDHFPSTLMQHYPEHLRHMTRAVELAKLPIHEQRKPIQAWDKQGKESKNPIITLMRPAFSKVYEAECRSQGTLRSMQAAIACERYRLKHKDWPKSLEELVQAKLLDAVPLDPNDGQPLRMIREEKSIVIYSIGSDQKDNRGHIDREHYTKDGVDIGFRLWNPVHRAGPPRPAMAALEP